MPKARDPYVVLGVPRGADITEVKRAYRRLVLALHPDRGDEDASSDRLREVQRAYETIREPAAGGDEARDEGGDAVVPVQRRAADPYDDPVDPEPLTYSRWRHGVRFDPEPFASPAARHVSMRMRRAYTPLDEELGGRVPEVLPGRPASVPKDLFVEVVLTERQAQLGGTFPLTVPVQKPCRACLGSGLGALTRHCSYCEGRGYRVDHKEMELVVPAGVRDGAQTEMPISSSGAGALLRVLVRVA